MSTDADLIEEYQGLVRSIALKVQAQFDLDADLDDLIADGFKGLIEADSRFDPSKRVQFNTFAYYRIRGAMIDGVRKNAFLPRRAYARLKAAEAALEIGEYVGEVRSSLGGPSTDTAATVESLHQTLAQLSASFVLASLGQDESAAADTPEESLLADESKSELHKALDMLPERERILVQAHYLEGRRFDEVAAELGISKSWASRLHSKALSRLREVLRPK